MLIRLKTNQTRSPSRQGMIYVLHVQTIGNRYQFILQDVIVLIHRFGIHSTFTVHIGTMKNDKTSRIDVRIAEILFFTKSSECLLISHRFFRFFQRLNTYPSNQSRS